MRIIILRIAYGQLVGFHCQDNEYQILRFYPTFECDLNTKCFKLWSQLSAIMDQTFS